jgi:hypothetical protein
VTEIDTMPTTDGRIDTGKIATTGGRIDTGKIVRDYFVHGHTESDIARSQGVSRQAVNGVMPD